MARVVLAHLVGNAVLLGGAYYWLGVGESDGLHLAWSAVLILLVAAGFAWLHGLALAHFRTASRLRLGNLFPLVLLVLATAAVYFTAEYWNPASASRINRTASYLTLTFQTPVRPASVERVFGAIWWVVEWVVIPLLLLPMAAGVAVRGWAGFAEVGARIKNWTLWLAVPVLLVLSIGVPFRLMAWTPAMSSFTMETLSLAARFGVAYLLFVGGGLMLAFVISRGRPVESQLNTVGSL